MSVHENDQASDCDDLAGIILNTFAANAFGSAYGVPCSSLSALFTRLTDHKAITYRTVTNEGEAVALAAGAWLAGTHSFVLLQNSGLGNAMNPIATLNVPYGIPALLLMSWRGRRASDEPQHHVMGRASPSIIKGLGGDWTVLSGSAVQIARLTQRTIDKFVAARTCHFLVVPPSLLPQVDRTASGGPCAAARSQLPIDLREQTALPMRLTVLERLLTLLPDNVGIVSTTGKCSRELYLLADRPQHFYVTGAMGYAVAVGCGVALHAKKRIVVIDGDGSALMHMGNFATVGAASPPNLVHIVLDNGVHDSTGGQPTASAYVDFSRIALACSYATASICDSTRGLEYALAGALNAPGPHFLRVCISPGSYSPLPRPLITLPELAVRFRSFLSST